MRMALLLLVLEVGVSGTMERSAQAGPGGGGGSTPAPAANGLAARKAPDSKPASTVPPSPKAPPSTSFEVPDGVAPEQVKSCTAGDAGACTAIAYQIAPKGGYRAELPKAEAEAREQRTARFALHACDLGNGEGCALAAHFGQYSLMNERLKRACDLDYVRACGDLGMRTFPSRGAANAAARKQQAVALVDRACQANAWDRRNPDDGPGGFCHALFVWYHDGEVPKNRKAEQRYLALACKQGFHVDCPCRSVADCGKDELCTDGICAVDFSE